MVCLSRFDNLKTSEELENGWFSSNDYLCLKGGAVVEWSKVLLLRDEINEKSQVCPETNNLLGKTLLYKAKLKELEIFSLRALSDFADSE